MIGSGVGAITAIFALTRLPDWRDRFEITIYQMGWRCGGKGASGRNAAHGSRIEEHGLHVWAGFYDNAFRHMRTCYEELARLGLRAPDAPLATMDAAFKPLSHLFLAERVDPDDAEPGPWRPWVLDMPANDCAPGTRTTVPGPFEMMKRVLGTMLDFLETDGADAGGADRPDALGVEPPRHMAPAHRAIHAHVQRMPDDPARHRASDTNALLRLISHAQAELHARMTPAAMDDDARRRGYELADLALAYMHGVTASDAFVAGYDVLDRWEFSDWLRGNGATSRSLAAAPVRGCYDFVFGFEGGDPARPGNVGAGTAVRAMSRLIFTYSTAIFHKMQAGMGDTIFAPYYQVLSALGVRFEFFSAARDLHLGADGLGVERLSMVRQAETRDGAPYRPLVDVEGLPCWPSAPLWDQLRDGDRLKAAGTDFESERTPPQGAPFTLERGRDFDVVLLGASIGSLPYMTGELAAASPRWRTMLDKVRTVGTHAAQLWLDRPTGDLGWRDLVERHNAPRAVPADPMRTIITAFAEPLDTWADMSHLIAREAWPDPGPASIAYFCAPAPDGEDLAAFEARMATWMDDDLTRIWPGAARAGGGFDRDLLHDGADPGLYARVNMHGSERYVLSVAGSVFHRLAPGESGFENLYLAGDWTRCGLNAGCVEAATISGIAAAAAISGEDMLNVGADDVPDDGNALDEAMIRTNSVSAAAWPLTPFFARGEMTGWFVFHEMPRDAVAALLPPGVHLGHAPMARPGFHPVGMSFCHYRDVRGSFVPGPLAMAPYGEATFAIPYTRTDEGGRAPYLYPRRLYVDSAPAILAGRLFYAMDKAEARIAMAGQRFTASSARGLSIDAEFEQRRDPVPLSGHAAHGVISDLLDMPFVTRHHGGRLLYNAFDAQLDRAYVAPVSGRVRVHDPDPSGFPAAALDAAPLLDRAGPGLPGAFRIWCSWSMTNPLDSRRIREANAARDWVRTGV